MDLDRNRICRRHNRLADILDICFHNLGERKYASSSSPLCRSDRIPLFSGETQTTTFKIFFNACLRTTNSKTGNREDRENV
jgi:hypothetical protein